jgi:hypothetical protein
VCCQSIMHVILYVSGDMKMLLGVRSKKVC